MIRIAYTSCTYCSRRRWNSSPPSQARSSSWPIVSLWNDAGQLVSTVADPFAESCNLRRRTCAMRLWSGSCQERRMRTRTGRIGSVGSRWPARGFWQLCVAVGPVLRWWSSCIYRSYRRSSRGDLWPHPGNRYASYIYSRASTSRSTGPWHLDSPNRSCKPSTLVLWPSRLSSPSARRDASAASRTAGPDLPENRDRSLDHRTPVPTSSSRPQPETRIYFTFADWLVQLSFDHGGRDLETD